MRPESRLTVSGTRGVVFIYVCPCFIDEIMALSSVLSIIRKALFENQFPVSHGIDFKVKRAGSVLCQQQLQPQHLLPLYLLFQLHRHHRFQSLPFRAPPTHP